ncbi:1-phosphatidylinositol bisphosphate phosphodiesterase-like protein [Emericellopsis cladophorae]|uniref:Phosphoinositide phospholipase C n=1 Tax=Emericellopsis cladophorae TaxID=2686198 RepID=A0A9Q0BHM4_9HYPO|nr:1-phosphatidylinositol bisphosphate phosphodiesterase-like protein [Emericellopsis cladophorae]KAI6784910.1 1-phosphatidylinositol bisphosphate phosphodiesterase-like protein [Emericellopsis cladophorae]
MSPDTAIMTTNSSIQGSPEPMRALDDDICPSNFQLPESIVSRRVSSSSLRQSLMNNASTIPETPEVTALPNPPHPKTSLMRRISSRASRGLAPKRRPSSAAPTSRDTSVGPLLRRRSDSNTTAPPDFPPMGFDSESDYDEDIRHFRSITRRDTSVRSTSVGSPAESIMEELSGSSMAGPTVPYTLQCGTPVCKFSSKKEKRRKYASLVYDHDSSKLTWDKKRPNKFIHLDDIQAVRSGSDVQQDANDLHITDISRLFAIKYSIAGRAEKLVYFQTDRPDLCQTWVKFLDDMLNHRQELMSSLMSFTPEAIKQYWKSEMARQFGDPPRSAGAEELDMAGVKRVCQMLHINSSESTLKSAFFQSDIRGQERLNYKEFMAFVRHLNVRPEIGRIMRSFAAQPEEGLTLEEFLVFLRNEQGEDIVTRRQPWEKEFYRLVRAARTSADDIGKGQSDNSLIMNQAAFTGYLTARHNGPLVEEPQQYSLDRPMNEYFISSSHNTYLTGRQIAGMSSVEPYIEALISGCRCVEIDCWDGPYGQPIVTHGRTYTSAISLKETLVTINKYAFVKTLFPLWISLEVRCKEEQQRVMPTLMREVFGARLVEETIDGNYSVLPSPSQLLERILIKVKKAKELPGAANGGRRRGNSLTSPMIRPTIPDAALMPTSQSLPQSPMLTPMLASRRIPSKNRVNTIAEGRVSDMVGDEGADIESGSDAGSYESENATTVKALGDLGVYCAGVKFNGFDSPGAKEFNHIFSFQEGTLAKNIRSKEMKMALDIHNMRYLMRVYPSPSRVLSSNFDPLWAWRRGVQMAALNWQTNDVALQLNRAMFEGGTDSSGYVLKPAKLRNIQVIPYNEDIAGGKKERSIVSCSIDVLSAQQLMRPASLPANREMHPYVEVEVFNGHGSSEGEGPEQEDAIASRNPERQQTDIVYGNGFNPFFRSAPMTWTLKTKHPELVFVKFTVKLSPNGETYNSNTNGKDAMGIASWTAKLQNLRPGYRTLPLENDKGKQYLFSSLFCKIHIDPIEKAIVDVPADKHERSKLKSLGTKVFGRMAASPRATMDKGSVEKKSSESAQ